jgi:hypothetical protein
MRGKEAGEKKQRERERDARLLLVSDDPQPGIKVPGIPLLECSFYDPV